MIESLTRRVRVDPVHAERKTKFFYSSFLEKRRHTLLLHRPLLSISRGDVKKVCHLWQFPLHPDVSNQSFQYGRNRIRKQLLPTLRFHFNRQLDGTLLQFTKLTSTELLYMEYLAQRLIPFICVLKRGYLAFHVGGLNPLPLAMKRQILKRGLERYATPSLNLCHVDNLFHFVEKKRLQSHRFPGESRLCLLPIRAEDERLLQNGKKGKIVQRVEEGTVGEDETLAPASHYPTSVKRGESMKGGESFSHFLTQYRDALKKRKKSSIGPRKQRKLLPHPKRNLLPPSRLLRLVGSYRPVKRWKDRLGMPTHRFLPTMGSLLFLGSDFFLGKHSPSV